MQEDFFRERLIQLRMLKGVSARDMSLSLGQNAGYINNIENGKALPSMVMFFEICNYFKVEPESFFSTENENPAKVSEIVNDLMVLNDDQLEGIMIITKELGKKNSR